MSFDVWQKLATRRDLIDIMLQYTSGMRVSCAVVSQWRAEFTVVDDSNIDLLSWTQYELQAFMEISQKRPVRDAAVVYGGLTPC